jgi:hypothetical protein
MDFWRTSARTSRREKVKEKTDIKNRILDDIWAKQLVWWEPGYFSQYSVWLQTGRPGNRGSIERRYT